MVTPYITFFGECKQALALYGRAFGTSVKMQQSYGDYVPEAGNVPKEELCGWILHAEMDILGTTFWFADEADATAEGSRVKLTARVATAAQAQAVFDVLQEGGRITLPPTDTFYSTFHAGLVDRFGVGWNIVAEEAPPPAAAK